MSLLDEAVFIPGHVEGAIPNTRRVKKRNAEAGDEFPDGAEGTVLSSVRVGDQLGYFVQFDAMPGVPVFLMAHRVLEIAQLPRSFDGREIK